MEAHIKRWHGEHCLKTENCVTCRVCEEKFVNKSALDKHTREAHSSSHLECAKCGKYFVKEKEVKEHMLIHVDEENFVKDKDLSKLKELTDEELDAACGGRTAHKGSRYGHKMTAKLDRIDEAEREYMENYNKKMQESKVESTEKQK